MTLQQLTYFLAAANHKSFSAAADSLLLSQPSLSEQIRRLEAELGVALFVRAGRGVELTEAGRLFQPHAERTLAEAEAAAGVGPPDPRRSPAAPSRSASSAAPITRCSSPLVRGLPQRHPEVRVRAVGQNSAEVADAVRDGQPRGRPRDPAGRRHAGSRSARRAARSCSTSPPIPSACRSR